jgi:hypothetical protein
MVAIAKIGPLSGVAPPKYLSGESILPHYCVQTGAGVSFSADTKIQIKMWLPGNQTFAGAKLGNTDASDTGEKFNVAIYSEAAIGGAGSLLVDLGEVTLTAAAATRTLATTFTTTYSGWYYIHVHVNATFNLWSIKAASTEVSAVGYVPETGTVAMIGDRVTTLSATPGTNTPFTSVSVAYTSAAPSTPTSMSAGTAIAAAPLVRLYF